MVQKGTTIARNEGAEEGLFRPAAKKETGARYQTQMTTDPDNPPYRQFAVSPCDDGKRGRLEPDVVIVDRRTGKTIAEAYIPGMKAYPLDHVRRS